MNKPFTPPLREPPHNIEAEQGLLGAILVNNEAFYCVSDFLEIVLERETWALIWIPVCCGCNGHEGRPDDPWECYSVSSKGHIWFHRSCLLRAFPEEARPPDDRASPL
jgi:DnaB-like helicase N terminal domain